MRAILSLSLAALNLAEREETIYGLNEVQPNNVRFKRAIFRWASLAQSTLRD